MLAYVKQLQSFFLALCVTISVAAWHNSAHPDTLQGLLDRMDSDTFDALKPIGETLQKKTYDYFFNGHAQMIVEKYCQVAAPKRMRAGQDVPSYSVSFDVFIDQQTKNCKNAENLQRLMREYLYVVIDETQQFFKLIAVLSISRNDSHDANNLLILNTENIRNSEAALHKPFPVFMAAVRRDAAAMEGKIYGDFNRIMNKAFDRYHTLLEWKK